MALTERTIVGSRNIMSDGQIQVRIDTIIERDGEEVSRTYWREVIAPGQDVSSKPNEIQRIALVEHTPSVIKAYLESISNQGVL